MAESVLASGLVGPSRSTPVADEQSMVDGAGAIKLFWILLAWCVVGAVCGGVSEGVGLCMGVRSQPGSSTAVASAARPGTSKP